jgi:hypothetical protein
VPKSRLDNRLGEYVSQGEFAAMLGKSSRHVGELIANEGLPCVAVGRAHYIPLDQAKTWLSDRVRTAGAKKRRRK